MDDAGCAIRRALVKVVDFELALAAILMMATRGTISFMEATCGSSVTLLGSARFSHCDPDASIVRQTGQQCVDPGVFHLSHMEGMFSLLLLIRSKFNISQNRFSGFGHADIEATQDVEGLAY
jgi:hypothetical protein